MDEVEQVYQEFWKPLVETDGVVNMEQVKKELFDFHKLMSMVPKVYYHVTGGQVSKVMTDPDIVISLADDLATKTESWCSECECERCHDMQDWTD